TKSSSSSQNQQPQQQQQSQPVAKNDTTSSSTRSSSGAAAATTSSPAAPVQDPVLTISEDGVQTFTYRDGRKTVVDPNTQVTIFYTAEHTATSYGDGTTHFLFANGAEVWTDKSGQSFAKDPRHA
ncbi:Hypothetical protein, putative, partial [Bodo saltans]